MACPTSSNVNGRLITTLSRYPARLVSGIHTFFRFGKNSYFLGADRTTSVVYGCAFSYWYYAISKLGPGSHSVGMGDQRVRFGCGGSSSHLASYSLRICHGDPDGYPDLWSVLRLFEKVSLNRIIYHWRIFFTSLKF